jgi:type I restriction enzyme S subunit
MLRPGYKRTEVGEIPEDWDAQPCEALSRLITVGIVVRPSQYYATTGIPALRSANIREAGIDYSDMAFIREEANRLLAKSQLRTGDVVSVRTGYPGTSAVVPARLEGANCIDILITRPRDTVNSAFLAAWINSPFGKTQVLRAQGGLAQQHFNVGELRSLVVAVPSTTAEQNAIAGALVDADSLIESLEHLLAKKRAIKQGAMQSLLTGAKRLPGFTEPWTPRSLSDLFHFSGGHSASRDQLSSTGHFYLHYGDIHTTSQTTVDVVADRDKLPRLNVPLTNVSPSALLDDGDVVFVDASEDVEGTSKHVVVVNPTHEPLISGLHTIVAKPRRPDLDRTYRRFCFQTPGVKLQFRFYAVGTKVLGVSKGNIGKVQMMIPPLVEQAAIAEVLADLDADLDATAAKLDKARAIKQGMMQELLTGRIRLV